MAIKSSFEAVMTKTANIHVFVFVLATVAAVGITGNTAVYWRSCYALPINLLLYINRFCLSNVNAYMLKSKVLPNHTYAVFVLFLKAHWNDWFDVFLGKS